MQFRALAVLSLSLALAVGCSVLVDASGLVGPASTATAPDAALPDGAATAHDGGSGGDAASDSGGDASDAGASCPSGRGPAMVRITDARGSFCIDTTEVTDTQFNAFLADSSRPTPPALCSYRTSFGGTARAADALPVTDVDWCEAWMFCAWAGKRLCGSRSGTPINDFGPANDGGVSEWFAACSGSGTRTFPYGATSNPSTCNGCDRAGACVDGGAGAPLVAVGSLTKCEGGYPGLFDMGGNVAEWEDNCNVDTSTAAQQQCPPRGGDRTVASADLHCVLQQLPRFQHRGDRSPTNGIRCCAD